MDAVVQALNQHGGEKGLEHVADRAERRIDAHHAKAVKRLEAEELAANNRLDERAAALEVREACVTWKERLTTAFVDYVNGGLSEEEYRLALADLEARKPKGTA